MANVCSNIIEITGKGMPELRKLVLAQDKSLDEIFCWFIGGDHYGLVNDVSDIDPNDDPLCLDFTSKWSPPEEDLQRLSGMFGGMEIHVQYEEPGMGCFGTLRYENGDKTDDTVMRESEYLYEFRPDYRMELDRIRDMPYDELLKNLGDISENLSLEDEGCTYIEAMLLSRIKDEDLPLLVNHEWCEWGGNEEAYHNRLKEATSGNGVSESGKGNGKKRKSKAKS